MILKIEKLEMHNIRTFQNQSVNFSNGINIVYGENGAGKTTLLQAILGSLLGFRYATRSGTQIQDLIRDGKKQGKIQLYFSLNNQEYRVVTILKQGKQEIMLQKLRPDSSWQDVAGPKVTEFEREMENLLGISAKVLNRVIYCPQNELTKIISSQAKDRKDVFERLLGINRYRSGEILTRELIQYGKMELKRIEEKIEREREEVEELPHIEIEINDCVNKIQQSQREIRRLYEEANRLEIVYKQLNQKKQKKDTLMGRLEELGNSIDKTKKELRDTQHILEQKKESTGILDSELGQINSLIEEAEKGQKKQEERESELRVQKGRINQILTEKQEIEKQLMETEKKIEILTIEINQLVPSLKELSEREISRLRTRLLNEIDDVRKKLDDLKSQISRLQAQEALLKEQISELSDKISSLRKEAKKQKENLGNMSEWKVEQFDSKIVSTEQQLKDKLQKLDETNSQIAIIKSRIENFKTVIDEIKERINLLQIEKKPICPVCKKELTNKERDRLLEEYKAQIITIHEEERNSQQNLSHFESLGKKLREDISRLEEQIKKLQEKKTIRKNLDDLLNLLESHRMELKSLEEEITRLNLRQLLRNKEDYEEALSKHETNLRSIHKAERKMAELLTCQKQLQPLTSKLNKFKEPIQEQLEKIETELSSILKKKKQYKEKIKNLHAIKELFQQIARMERSKEKQEKQLQTLRKELKNLDFNEEELEAVRIRQKETSGKLEREKKSLEYLEQERLVLLRNKREELECLEKELTQDLLKKQDYERFLALLEVSKAIFKEFPEHIAEIRLSNAQERANQIIRRFFEDRNIDGLQITHERYEIKAIRAGRPESIERLSGGEQAVLALSMRISLMEELGQVGLMLLDEPTSALDQSRIEEFVSFLEQNKIFQQLILVTHRDEFLQSADNPIHIKRQFDISRITAWDTDNEK